MLEAKDLPDPAVIGVIKKLDGKGRVTIPLSQLEYVGIDPDAYLSLVAVGNAIVLQAMPDE
jgi:bifunctional DNA-binding transcriptional regulator/antitoxin component of YhaV-PrlF toxin-antitoxin module